MLCRSTTCRSEEGTIFLIPGRESLTIGIARQSKATKPTTEIRLSKGDVDAVVAVLCSFMVGMETAQIQQLHDKIVEEVKRATRDHVKREDPVN